MRCLVTGATGNIGSLVTRRLIERGERPCVLVRDAVKAREAYGDAVEIRVGDLAADRASLALAFDGVDALFLVNSGPDLAARDREAAFAARTAGVRQLIKLSTLDARSGVGTGPWHAEGEAAVRESGVAFTFVQTAAFMSNALFWADAIATEGVLRTSTGDGTIAFIHPADIADVAVRALTTRDHLGQSLVITGPRALSYAEMATIVGDAIGRTVRFERITDDEARIGSGAYADALVDIWRAIREGRVSAVTHEVERILGRAPISFERWALENAGAFVRPGGSRAGVSGAPVSLGRGAPSARPPLSRSRSR
jgi:uncharacterized protein YbjT (DUF2867 family)